MPIYEYRCKKCGETSEILVRDIQETEHAACSECGSRSLERLISAPNIPKEAAGVAAEVPRCGKGSTCCGSDTPCESPPCG